MSGSLSSAAVQDALARAKQLAASGTDSGQKRAAGDSPSDTTPAKRPHSEDDMAGNPIAILGNTPQPNLAGMQQEIFVEQYEVPDHAVGLVIGRGGEQITNIQATSGCRVQMAPDSGGPSRPCTLQGTKMSIEKAKEMINGVIHRSGGRPPPSKGPGMAGGGPPMGGGPMGGGGGGMAGGQLTEEMMIPGSKCGLVIGKGGETIKMIQERCGVKVVLIQDNVSAGENSKPLRIIGDPQKVAGAKQMVEEIINSRPGEGPAMGMGGGGGGMGGFGSPYGGGAGAQKSIGEVIVPRSSVGVIIGKGGETIRRLSAESGAKIQFKQDEEQNAPERTAVIQGSPDQIQKATQLISDLVNRSSENGNVFYMHIPANKTGLVIGRGGETIKQINAESGAHCELSRDPPPNSNEKVFVIKGTEQQIAHAQHVIRIKVGDIAPGTPFHWGQGGGGPGGGDWANGAGQAQWGAYPQQQAGGDPASWASYYAQMGQQQQPQPQQPYAQPQAAPAAAPAAQAAPAINPATGQPDYSAQWVEYYRNLGMHDQAAVIEQQAKQNQAGGGAPAAQPQQQPQQSYPGGYAPAASAAGGGAAPAYANYASGGAPAGNGQQYGGQGYQQPY